MGSKKSALESVVDNKMLFDNAYHSKKVLITGHTGFKGSWLAYWLQQLGATVYGYSTSAPTMPNHIQHLNLDIHEKIGDIRDFVTFFEFLNEVKPDIIFHLAAQPLVRYSYGFPLETFETNVMGTTNIYEAVRQTDFVKAIVSITTDKVYDNKEWVWGYRESDPLGGYDPYSASKGAVEIVTQSYQKSFFNPNDYMKTHHTLLASCRAGNVIGGGDWAEDRLVPDIVRATVQKQAVRIRNPKSVRPWQHVLEPLSGYLMVGQQLLNGHSEYAAAWNFGPDQSGSLTVQEVIDVTQKVWPEIQYDIQSNSQLHEANLLRLDCSKAISLLRWNNVWDSREAISKTMNWYKAYYHDGHISTANDLNSYISDARENGLNWTCGH